MCGIAGYIGNENGIKYVFDALKKLEYRGYDSAGIAVLNKGVPYLVKAKGKLINLEPELKKLPESKVAIGHTRWATHGPATVENAHPHKAGKVCLVHNGIIENYSELKEELQKEGAKFSSDTDTEVISHLINKYFIISNQAETALRSALKRLKGAFALGVLFEGVEDKVFLAKKGSPLCIGQADGATFFGSDITVFADFSQKAIFLEDNEYAIIDKDNIQLFNIEGENKQVKVKQINYTAGATDKKGYRHYMLKEIHEQPAVISKSIQRFVKDNSLNLSELGLKDLNLDKVKDINIVACGTAYLSGVVAKYLIEPLIKVPVNVELASEFRYRSPFINKQGETLIIAISQSGETADTLASIEHAKSLGSQVFAICNTDYSSIVRASNAHLLMGAGPEIGVASTKAFTSQVLCLYLWALGFAKVKSLLPKAEEESILSELKSLPVLTEVAINNEEQIKSVANKYYEANNFIYIGRGPSCPIATEGALKLKEVSYIHAEGYAAGELKHGPIALVDRHLPLVAIAPQDSYYEKTISNIEEICAREGRVIGIGKAGDDTLKGLCEDVIECPQSTNPAFQAILSTIPIQFLAYHIAVKRGTDVDQPRNLAKSVTVE